MDVTKHKHLEKWEKFAKELGIPDYYFYVGKSTRPLKVRSLTGPEKLKVFKSINIQSLLPTLPACNHKHENTVAMGRIFKTPNHIF